MSRNLQNGGVHTGESHIGAWDVYEAATAEATRRLNPIEDLAITGYARQANYLESIGFGDCSPNTISKADDTVERCGITWRVRQAIVGREVDFATILIGGEIQDLARCELGGH